MSITSSGDQQQEKLLMHLRNYVGNEETLRKFVHLLNTKGRERGALFYWQEELWKGFVRTHPEYSTLDFRDCADQLYLCHIHWTPLHRARVPVQRDLLCVVHTPEIAAQIANEAPYSALYVPDSPHWDDVDEVSVDHCVDCLARRQELGE